MKSHPSVAWWILLCAVFVQSGCTTNASAGHTKTRPAESASTIPAVAQTADNPELRELYDNDQADRKAKKIDGMEVSRRDEAREKRVRELLDAGEVKTGRDYYHAALVFQLASTVEGIELAHELAIIGVALGDRNAKWLAAASYDRLLVRLKRGQRFGTQYGASDSFEPMHMMPIEPGVTDTMRRALNCPVLDKTEQSEAEAANSRAVTGTR